MSCQQGYLLENGQAEAASRFGAISEIFDSSTFRHIEAIGIEEGWRCWEVGAGGPVVAAWLADRVGHRGHVLATDIDVRHLTEPGAAYEVRRHDVGTDPTPTEAFDLVHARLLLVHLPRRGEALRSMVESLRPGGWLVVEDADPALQPLSCPDQHGPEQQLANQVRQAFRALLDQRGADLAYGRTLPRLLRAAGLSEVAADVYFPLASPACTRLEQATLAQVRDRLVSAGLVSDEEIARHLTNVTAGRLDLTTAAMVSAWGRRSQ